MEMLDVDWADLFVYRVDAAGREVGFMQVRGGRCKSSHVVFLGQAVTSHPVAEADCPRPGLLGRVGSTLVGLLVSPHCPWQVRRSTNELGATARDALCCHSRSSL